MHEQGMGKMCRDSIPPPSMLHPKFPCAHWPGSFQNHVLSGTYGTSLHRHDWWNHWPLVIKIHLQSLSPPQTLVKEWDFLITCLTPLATRFHPLAVSESHLISGCSSNSLKVSLISFLAKRNLLLFSTPIGIYLCYFLAHISTYIRAIYVSDLLCLPFSLCITHICMS